VVGTVSPDRNRKIMDVYHFMRTSYAILLAIVGTACGAAVDHKLRPPEWRVYPEHREPFVLNLAGQFGPADTVVFGDSLTEQTILDGACGRTFNAGVGGAFVSDVQAIAPAVMRAVQPNTVVLSIGTNHFVGHRNEVDLFRHDLGALSRTFSGHRLVLVGLRASREGDSIVRDIARQLHATYVAPVDGPGLIGPDGIHHTPAGSRAYRSSIAHACLVGR
jgi:hypothetical protein